MNQDADLIIAPEEPSPDAVEVPVLEVFDRDEFLIRIKPSEFTDNLSDQLDVEVIARYGGRVMAATAHVLDERREGAQVAHRAVI
jgi:hypothetical protein